MTGMTAEGGGVLAGAAFVAFSSSSVISTLYNCTQGNVCTGIPASTHIVSDYIIVLWTKVSCVGVSDVRRRIYLLATNDGLFLTTDVPVASC